MRKLVRRLIPVTLMALTPTAAMTIATPAVSSAQCGDGQYWEPFSKTCLPLGVGPRALNCPAGQWWDPSGDDCKPLGVGPTPLGCDPGMYWEPSSNTCRRLGEGPPGPDG
jgi:hypothetical protein